jgi:hypothetical protein
LAIFYLAFGQHVGCCQCHAAFSPKSKAEAMKNNKQKFLDLSIIVD